MSENESRTKDIIAASTVGLSKSFDISPSLKGIGKSLAETVRAPRGFEESLTHLGKISTKIWASAGLNQFSQALARLQVDLSPLFEEVVRSLRENLQKALKPLFKRDYFHNLDRQLLPPNLRSASDKISSRQVLAFVKEEGIPLYFVPRAAIGVRLLNAETRQERRKVLNDRFNDIVDDCASFLDSCEFTSMQLEPHLVHDGIAAIRNGHYPSAQAVFTIALDSLILQMVGTQTEVKRDITNKHPDDSAIPERFHQMSLATAYVWLPVWNAHETFWKQKGDKGPSAFSRHATIHGASKRQFSKRNCVQALMLATSLLGYQNQLAKSTATTR